MRILIADDNPSVRIALRHLLESIGGWEVVDVENGKQAVAVAQELRPNIIILDLVMPVMDGLAAARELSKLVPGVPLLMHTLHWSPQVKLEAQKVGVREVVPKADSKGLVSAIQQALAAEPPTAVSAFPEAIPAVLPPSDITALPPITDSECAKAAPADEPEAPKVSGPDDATESSPPS